MSKKNSHLRARLSRIADSLGSILLVGFFLGAYRPAFAQEFLLQVLQLPTINQLCSVQSTKFSGASGAEDEILRNPVHAWGRVELMQTFIPACMKTQGANNEKILTDKTCNEIAFFYELFHKPSSATKRANEDEAATEKRLRALFESIDLKRLNSCMQEPAYEKNLLNSASSQRENIFKSYTKSVPQLIEEYKPYQLNGGIVSYFVMHLPSEESASLEVWIGYRSSSEAHLQVVHMDNRAIHGNAITVQQFDSFVEKVASWKEANSFALPTSENDFPYEKKKWNEGFTGLLSLKTPTLEASLRFRGWEIHGVPDQYPGARLSRLQVELANLRGFDFAEQEKAAQEQRRNRLEAVEYQELSTLMAEDRLKAFQEKLAKPLHIRLGRGFADGMPDYGLFFNAVKRKDPRFARALLEAGLTLLTDSGALQPWVRKQFYDRLENYGYQRSSIENLYFDLKKVLNPSTKKTHQEFWRLLDLEIQKLIEQKR
jgi:hypothetical protein